MGQFFHHLVPCMTRTYGARVNVRCIASGLAVFPVVVVVVPLLVCLRLLPSSACYVVGWIY